MKKIAARRLRLDAETLRPLDATRAVTGAGFIYVTAQVVCSGGRPNSQDGSTASTTSLSITTSPNVCVIPGSLACG
jgi:hypothetical protein